MKVIGRQIKSLLRLIKFIFRDKDALRAIRLIPAYLGYLGAYPPDQFLQFIIQRSKHIAAKQGQYYYDILNNPLAYDEYLDDFNFDSKIKQDKVSGSSIYQPQMCILMPIYGCHHRLIIQSLQSVKKQTYENWSFYIFVNQGIFEDISKLISSVFSDDDRIIVKSIKDIENNLSVSFTDVIDAINSEYICFLSEGDQLAKNGLFEIARFLNEHRDAKVIYSDHALVSNGAYIDVVYKPGWSPDLILSKSYMKNLLCCERETICSVGGMRGTFEDEMKYDLVLRIIEKTNKISHLPRLLYYEEVPKDMYAKGYNADNCVELQKKALQDHVKRVGIKAEVCDGIFRGSFRVRREILNNSKVSIIIPTKDNLNQLETCLESIEKKTDYQNYEIIIVDNDSSDPRHLEYLDGLRYEIIKFPEKYNFSKINNIAAEQANGKYLVFLNSDTEVNTTDWLGAMVEHAQRKEVGVVGAKLLYPNGMIQHSGVILTMNRHPDHANRFVHYYDHGVYGQVDVIRNYNVVTAACMMMRMDVFREVGGYDEDLAIVFQDTDLCFKVRSQGYLIVYTPYAELYHYEGISRWTNLDEFLPDTKLFFSRWRAIYGDDAEI